MPRLTTSVPKYSLHKASGQAVIRLNGRDIYLGAYNSKESKTNYRRLIAEWSEQGRHNAVGCQPDGPTIDEVILAYLRHASGYYLKNGQPTTTQRHIRDALKPLHELYGKSSALRPLSR